MPDSFRVSPHLICLANCKTRCIADVAAEIIFLDLMNFIDRKKITKYKINLLCKDIYNLVINLSVCHKAVST